MRILMFLFNQTNQGTYWRAFHLAHELQKMGNNVTLVSTSRERHYGIKEQLIDGITFVETPDLFNGSLRSGWDLWNIVNRIFWLKNKEFDLIHAFESRPTVIIPMLIYLRQHPIPLIMDWSDWFGKGGSVEERPNRFIRTFLRPVETFFEEHFRALAQGTTVICSTLQRKAEGLGISPETILNLKNGADLQSFRHISTSAAKAELGIDSKDLIIGYLGSVFRSDARFILDSFDRVLQQISTVKLLIIGYCPFDFRKVANHPDRIFQTGYLETPKVRHYLAACDLFWLPLTNTNTNRGRFPYKFTDYLSIGRPIVATKVGDIPEVFPNGEIGYLSVDEPDEFSCYTLNLLRSVEIRERMGIASRELAEKEYSWELLAKKLEGFYTKTIERFKKSEK